MTKKTPENAAKVSPIETFFEQKFLKLEEKKRRLIAAGVAVAVVAGVGYFSLYPNISDSSSLDKKFATAEKKLSDIRKKASVLSAREDILMELQTRFKQASLLLPEDRNVDAVIKNIADLGMEVGLEFQKFDPERQEKVRNYYNEMGIEIQVIGSYSSIGAFLSKLTKMSRLVAVSDLRINDSFREGEEVLNSASLSLVLYRFTDDKLLTEEEKKALAKKNK